MPRWTGDANFIAVAAETRVLPISLDEAGRRIRAAWPRLRGPPVPSTAAMADDTTRDEDVTDALPEDLNAAEYVGPYVFPNNNRRRVPGYLYLGARRRLHRRLGDRRARRRAGQRRLPRSPGVLLVLLGAYHLVAGWNLDVDERDALVAATREVGFAVGHASAQLGWRGLRSRPTWRILAVLSRGAAAEARPRARRRGRRRDRRPLRRGQPGGLVRPRHRGLRRSGAIGAIVWRSRVRRSRHGYSTAR